MNLDKNNNPLPPTDFSQHSSLQNQPVQALQPHGISDKEQSLISYNHITYALYAFSFFTAGLTWIVPIVMNYMKRDETRGTWLYSHFDWQIKTFWYSIFFVVLGWTLVSFGTGGLLFGVVINHGSTMAGSFMMAIFGGILLGVSYLWHLYRLVRGWIALSSRRPIG